MFSCWCKAGNNTFNERTVLIDNKLLKIYSDFEMENLEAIIDFDLLDCQVKPLNNFQF